MSSRSIKLFYSPVHDFIHKSVVVAEEVGVWSMIEEVPVYPRRHGYSIAAINPLQKVPTLALADGTVLYGSQTIVEYLDSVSVNGIHVYPAAGLRRWSALRRLALADIFFDVIVRIGQERLPKEPGTHIVKWNWPKLLRALDQMDIDIATADDFDIGHIGTLQALTYLERQVDMVLPSPAPKTFDWREGRPRLADWFERAIARPSVASHYKKPFAGEDSPEYCQAKIAEVLRAQGRTPGPVTLPSVDFVAPETADISAH